MTRTTAARLSARSRRHDHHLRSSRSIDTIPQSINRAGVITGTYTDAQGYRHGFLRARDGSFTTFDPAGSVSTLATAINARGEIAGYYQDQTATHGFLRSRDGAFTTFDAPGCCTEPNSINQEGTISGYYFDYSGNVTHGFLRARGGTITSFDPPGAAEPCRKALTRLARSRDTTLTHSL